MGALLHLNISLRYQVGSSLDPKAVDCHSLRLHTQRRDILLLELAWQGFSEGQCEEALNVSGKHTPTGSYNHTCWTTLTTVTTTRPTTTTADVTMGQHPTTLLFTPKFMDFMVFMAVHSKKNMVELWVWIHPAMSEIDQPEPVKWRFTKVVFPTPPSPHRTSLNSGPGAHSIPRFKTCLFFFAHKGP